MRTRAGLEGAGEEAERFGVARVIALLSAETDLLISVDTYKGAVARAALGAGAHMINDIGGFMHDTETADAAARAGAAPGDSRRRR